MSNQSFNTQIDDLNKALEAAKAAAAAAGDPATTTPTPEEEAAKKAEEELQTKLTELGFTKDQYEKLVEKGLAVKPGVKPEDLPTELKKLLDEKANQERKIAQDKLYETINKIKKDLEDQKEIARKKEEELSAAEEAKRKALEDEAFKKKSLEEKLEETQRKTVEAIEKITNVSTQQIQELETKLYQEKLNSIRKELILAAGGNLITELVADPFTNPKLTEEELVASVETAVAKYSEIAEKFKKEQPANTAATATGQRNIATPPNGGNISGQQRTIIDPEKIRTMNREQLKDVQDKLFKELGLTR